MPDRGREAAMEVVERARSMLARRTFAVGGAEIGVTFSAGLSRGGGEQGYSSLLTDADKALYLAKSAGRNRVVHADDVVSVAPVGGRLSRQKVG